MIYPYIATETFSHEPLYIIHTYRCRFSGLVLRSSGWAGAVKLEAHLENGPMKWCGQNWWAPSYSTGYRNRGYERLPEVSLPELSFWDRLQLEFQQRKSERGY